MPADSYTNNRRDGWDYDAEGNLLGSLDTTYSYDAAGEIRTVGTYEPQSTTTRGLDGDGQQLRTVESTYKESSQTWETTTTYYLHSTVLGGKVLTEMGADGAKTRTFVYAGGTVLAWQKFYTNGAQTVEWEHRDPSDATFRTTNSNGSTWEGAELDPTKIDAGTHAPLISPNPPDDSGTSLLPYPSFMDAHSGLTKTYGDERLPITADQYMRQTEFMFHGSFLGMAQFLVNASLRNTGQHEIKVFSGFSYTTVRDDSGATSGGWHPQFDTVTVRDYNVWGADSWSFAFAMLPQNPVSPEDLRAYGARIESMLKVSKCSEFLSQLLNQAKVMTGRSFGSILATFGKITFYWGDAGSFHGGNAYFEHGVPAATISNTINTEKMGGSLANQRDRHEYLTSSTTQAFLGETLHHVGVGRMYGDGEMANALNAILVKGGLDTPRVFSDKTSEDVDNASRYWHPKVWDACPAPRK